MNHSSTINVRTISNIHNTMSANKNMKDNVSNSGSGPNIDNTD